MVGLQVCGIAPKLNLMGSVWLLLFTSFGVPPCLLVGGEGRHSIGQYVCLDEATA